MTTQNYKVIPIEDYGIVIDEKADIYNVVTTDGVKIYHPSKAKDTAVKLFPEEFKKKIKKVIGSVDKRIDGVPLINLKYQLTKAENKFVEETTSIIKEEVTKKIVETCLTAGIKYKANNGVYSEENMLHFAKYAIDNVERGGNKSELTEMLQSFKKQPIPIEVELETEPACTIARGLPVRCLCIDQYYRGEDCKNLLLKITNKETNTIIALNHK